MPYWKCGSCGLIYEGSEAPEKCPKCGALKNMFTQVPDDQVKLIEKSCFSNGLHMEAYTLLGELLELSEKGIQDNLDPACVKIFTEEREFAKLMMQKIKAELKTHMERNKWG